MSLLREKRNWNHVLAITRLKQFLTKHIPIFLFFSLDQPSHCIPALYSTFRSIIPEQTCPRPFMEFVNIQSKVG